MKKTLLALLLLLTAGVTTAAQSKDPVTVLITTSKGNITVELLPDKAPETVANFLRYVDEGFYNGTIFHRVISGFMIQGGGFQPGMTQKATRAPIKNEADNGLKNDLGTIAMARTSDPHSATAQFFINTKDNPNLDHQQKSTQGWGYCVFGKVSEVPQTERTPFHPRSPYAAAKAYAFHINGLHERGFEIW